ncbi:helix-turn-helix domain-containing protein [Chryseobacterium sp. RG1]|uniref:Helix-turn-helix domain-containing protein n=1 Tax=Chryseobacterium tagetis TaxID=2801334 RepID=A0ABS8A0J1_9FLAO|nr:helix-turn-helix domain-containing protein [Chryseobacterium tagetis]MCA6067511.1 helix-turn-helix domain-containing protein [Chryseobacterium tagetis]
MTYTITDRLKKTGFSMNPLSYVLDRNQGKKDFNTLEYFNVWFVFDDVEMIIEGRSYDIKGVSTVFIGPHKSISFGECKGKEVYVFSFSSIFYEQSSTDSVFLNSALFFNYGREVLVSPYVGDVPKEIMRYFLINRLLDFQKKDERLFVSAAHNTLETIILDALLTINDDEIEKDEKLEYVSYVNKFRVMLQRDFKTEKKVSYYASALHITTRKLTSMTEFIAGKSAKEMIIDKLVNEFEKSVKYTTLTISEISYQLGFSDEANFTNFIKKHTGKKPTEFRSLVSCVFPFSI